MGDIFINKFVKICTIIEIHTRLQHWNTQSYAVHKATDQLLDNLLSLQDKFVETFSGLYDIRPNLKNFKVDDPVIQEYIYVNNDVLSEKYKLFRETLRRLCNQFTIESELHNIKDEILGELSKTIYLLRLQ
jgi:hypothetical protein